MASPLGPSSVHDQIEGRVVLVTGAGGTVGAELCRQVAAQRPARLLMLDHDETRLIEAWLSLEAPSPARWDDLLLADVRELDAVVRTVVQAHPDIVLHAAHLGDHDLLERYPREGWLTNVTGTRNLLEAATLAGVGLFVNVSSMVALDGASVAGQTHQLSEELTAQWAHEEVGRYVSVRHDAGPARTAPALVHELCGRLLASATTALDGCVVDATVEGSPAA